MHGMLKRKIRADDDDVEAEREPKASHLPRTNEKTQPAGQNQYTSFSLSGLRFATESWAGMKTNNEDRHTTSTAFFPGPVFGIFDGHGGTFTADFLSRQLVKTVGSVIQQSLGEKALDDLRRSQELSRQEKDRNGAIIEQTKLLDIQLSQVEAMRLESTDSDTHSFVESADGLQALVDQLTGAISQMNGELEQIGAEETIRRQERLQWCAEHHRHFLRSFKDAFERVDTQVLQKNPLQDGSTALLVWFLADSVNYRDGGEKQIQSNQPPKGELSFYTVNVGDCRAVMCRGGRGVPLTSDHKPDRPDEKQRIEKAGGFVGKLAGVARVFSAAGAGLAVGRQSSTYLAVSRAFGDRTLKAPTPLVSSEPEVKRFQVQADDLFIVLACDGIWDVLSEQDVVDIALPHFHDPKAAADAIVKVAYKKGSADNLTVTVVQFGWKSDAQVQRAVERIRTGRRDEEQNNGDTEEEIDMFNL